jgi:AraC-like DNA-binding protein
MGAGLENAFLYPLPPNDRSFRSALERVSNNLCGDAVLRSMEPALGKLPASLQRTLHDLFARPYRYKSASDIAYESGIPMRALYRTIRKARLGTPKKLITVAKVARGYGYLRASKGSVYAISKELGYARARIFASQVSVVLGCRAKGLRRDISSNEALMRLLEWLHKPSWRAA